MLLKKAAKYENDDSAGRLEELIIQWRNAGREMVERLFSLIPRPLDDGLLQTSSAYAPNAFSSGWYEGPSTLELTPEQQDYLAKAPLNKDDEPVDTEGNAFKEYAFYFGIMVWALIMVLLSIQKLSGEENAYG